MKVAYHRLGISLLLQLLGELLLDRHNFSIMTRYISNPDNLKLMMNMLKVKSRNIQFEAFHVFKVGSVCNNLNKPQVENCERWIFIL